MWSIRMSRPPMFGVTRGATAAPTVGMREPMLRFGVRMMLWL